jgi:hypothetical protein
VVSTAPNEPSGLPDDDSDDALKTALHRVFDGAIPNYGDYNLVCATECGGTITDSLPHGPLARGLVIGYRRRPAEIVVAPFDRASLAPAGRPLTADLTNLAYVAEGAHGTFDISTSTGRIVTFTLRDTCSLAFGDAVPGRLYQEDDATDFAAFLRDLAAL